MPAHHPLRRLPRATALPALLLALLALSCGEEGQPPEPQQQEADAGTPVPEGTEEVGEVAPGPDTPQESGDTVDAQAMRLNTSAIRVSARADRSSAISLQGSTAKGSVAIFVTPGTLQRVDFYLDDPSRARAPITVETAAPFDFAGTAAGNLATLYDTRGLSNGSHSVSVVGRDASGRSYAGTASFTVSNATATPPPPGAPTSCPVGQLLASYFPNATLSGTAAVVRCEPLPFNYQWGSGSPGSGLAADNFSARWTGQVSLPAGNVAVRARVDDGMRVWLDGKLVLDQWRNQVASFESVSAVTQGTHTLKVEYYEGSWGALVELALVPGVAAPPPPAPAPDAGAAPPPPTADAGTTLPPPPAGPGYAAFRNGRVEVDGQPFFPHGYYFVTWGTSAADMLTGLRNMAAAGFNTVHASRTDSNNYAAFLDEADKLGMKVITEGAPDATIGTLKGKHAVLGWNIGDDVHQNVTPEQLAAKHAGVKAADPNHLTYFTVYSWDKWGPYLDKGDLPAPYNYPISGSWLGEVDYAMNIARGAGRPMIGIPQAFAWPNDRAPTAAEARNMLYQNLVNNVKGIIYYNYNEGTPIPTKHPELWNATKSFVPEINRLAPALTQGTFTKLNTGVDRLLAATWRLGTQLYVVVINTHETDAKVASLTLPATGTAQALFSGRPSGLQFSNGRLQGTVNARDVHVYLLTAQ